MFPYEGAYVGLPTMFYPTGVDANSTNCDGFDLIQLAVSRDLVKWDRLGNREPFLPTARIDDGRLGVWDRTLMFATPPIERDDELWFYYSALKWRDDSLDFNPDRRRCDRSTFSAVELADRAEGSGAPTLCSFVPPLSPSLQFLIHKHIRRLARTRRKIMRRLGVHRP